MEWVIKLFEPYKVPGIDGSSYFLGPLTKVFRASIALRHVSQACRASKVVFIPKPGKDGYICAKDFRPISLTYFLLKTLERLFDRLVKTWPLVKHPLAASQYAYREGRSTETAVHHLVSRVEKQLETKGYVSVEFLDIEGAFYSSSKIAIEQAVITPEIPRPLVEWTENMLAGRNLIVHHRDVTTEDTPDRGCPQGGVSSPLLWCVMANDL